MTTEQVSSLMKGEPGTRLKMKVAKFYTGDTVQVELKREIINIPGIPYYGMLPDSVGYILNIDFTDEVSNDMRNAIMSLREQGAKALILDYRNNGGGIVQEAGKILSFFVPRVRCRTWTGRCSSAAEPSVRGSCSLPGRSVTMLI